MLKVFGYCVTVCAVSSVVALAGPTASAADLSAVPSAPAPLAGPAAPVAAGHQQPWRVDLTAGRSQLWPTENTTLTAVSNHSVSGTPYRLSIFDLDARAYVAVCATGATCVATVTRSTAGPDSYVALVSLKPRGPVDYPPPGYVAYDVAQVQWNATSVSLAASPTTVAVGGSTTLTATTSADVSSSPFFIEIYDTSTHTLLNSCGDGTVCTATETADQAMTDSFVAYVASYDSSDPPRAVQATSAVGYVTWSDEGFGVSLATTAGSATATATVPGSPGPYTMEIFDETAGGTLLTSCASVPTCTASTSAGHELVAFVSAPGADTTLPPTDGQASSAVVTAV
jgi:hypothetical protein